jgi:hypothetical protein
MTSRKMPWGRRGHTRVDTRTVKMAVLTRPRQRHNDHHDGTNTRVAETVAPTNSNTRTMRGRERQRLVCLKHTHKYGYDRSGSLEYLKSSLWHEPFRRTCLGTAPRSDPSESLCPHPSKMFYVNHPSRPNTRVFSGRTLTICPIQSEGFYIASPYQVHNRVHILGCVHASVVTDATVGHKNIIRHIGFFIVRSQKNYVSERDR